MTESKLVVHLDQQEEYESWEKSQRPTAGSRMAWLNANRNAGAPLTGVQYDSIQSSIEKAQHDSDRR